MQDPALNKVIEELKSRGLRAGEDEAARIKEAAEADAVRIRAEARAEAERLLAKAKDDAQALKRQLDTELRQAAGVGLVAFRQALEQALLVPEINATLRQALGKPEWLQELLLAAAAAFASAGGGKGDLAIILPASQQEALGQAFVANMVERLGKGVSIRFDKGLTAGFQLAPGGTGYVLDFTEEGFQEVFLAFLAPRFRRYFFAPEEPV